MQPSQNHGRLALILEPALERIATDYRLCSKVGSLAIAVSLVPGINGMMFPA
jgi:hypothetical protein